MEVLMTDAKGKKPTEKKEWTMPGWMELYREIICNTGGNPIEELMNDTGTNFFNNHVRSALIVAVSSQVALLNLAHAKGLLRE
jgi:hypothetical protein